MTNLNNKKCKKANKTINFFLVKPNFWNFAKKTKKITFSKNCENVFKVRSVKNSRKLQIKKIQVVTRKYENYDNFFRFYPLYKPKFILLFLSLEIEYFKFINKNIKKQSIATIESVSIWQVFIFDEVLYLHFYIFENK